MHIGIMAKAIGINPTQDAKLATGAAWLMAAGSALALCVVAIAALDTKDSIFRASLLSSTDRFMIVLFVYARKRALVSSAAVAEKLVKMARRGAVGVSCGNLVCEASILRQCNRHSLGSVAREDLGVRDA